MIASTRTDHGLEAGEAYVGNGAAAIVGLTDG
jgi:hypothetical protein